MSLAITETISVLQILVQNVPMGTNLALLQLMWTIINGSFLQSRGAIFPALQANGMNASESRRLWQALRRGVWRIDEFIQHWRDYVASREEWVSHSYEGYKPVSLDWTAIWRFKLKGWTGKWYHGLAGRALCGIGFAIVCDVGQIGEQRIPLIRKIIRPSQKDPSPQQLKEDSLAWAYRHLAADEVLIVDAGAEISDMEAAKIPRYVVRQARNCTARRNELPSYKGKGCYPKWGATVRPLARSYKGKEIAATPPDKQTRFEVNGRVIEAHGWHNLILPCYKPGEAPSTFTIWVFLTLGMIPPSSWQPTCPTLRRPPSTTSITTGGRWSRFRWLVKSCLVYTANLSLCPRFVIGSGSWGFCWATF